ncbi:hypothetical protein ACPUVO_08225 [Pseudocolwellia sp. HL-MZ19]|uniref:tetratricopeptide repeat protein n=1 Tax=Pseudocolwellia sp. HL-MZ19 TaxID=3400846 RepID=UPI003CF15A16
MNKVILSLVIAASVTAMQLPLTSTAFAAGVGAEEKAKRPTQLVGPSVGKKVAAAFELYSADDIPGALQILLDIDAKKDYDKAYVNRFIAIMYATMGDKEEEAIKYLEMAIKPDILNEGDHGDAIKLVADLQMQTQKYRPALVNYNRWMDFTGKSDGDTWVKIANAHYSLQELDKVIAPADKAIAAFGDKQSQNPYILKLTSYYERKKFKDAVNVLETAVQLFPDVKTFWVQLGQFYTLVEDYDKALATLDLAYKQGYLEKESEIKVLASLYSQKAIPFKSATLLEKHIASGTVKRDDKNLSTLANAWHAAQHIDKAAKYYGELAKMTNEAKYYSKQGMLLKQDEQFKSSIVAFNKALELGVDNRGQLYMSIAEAHFYLEQYKLANNAIEKAMKDPKTKRAAKGWSGFIKDTAQRKKVSI